MVDCLLPFLINDLIWIQNAAKHVHERRLGLVMGLSQKCLTRVESGQYFIAQVGSGLPSLVWVWKISPKNQKIFYFFPFRSKKISLGWVKMYTGWRRVALLFTAGQKHAQIGSGPISIPVRLNGSAMVMVLVSSGQFW